MAMLNEELRRWRKERELSYAEVAAWAGVTEMTVRNWESGRSVPSIEKLQTLDKRWPGVLRLLVRSPVRRA